MRFGSKVELRRRAPAANFHVVRGSFSDGHARVRNIGDRQQELLEASRSSSAMRSSSRLICSDTSFMRARIAAGVLAGFLQPGDLIAGLVALGLEALVLRDELAPLRIERAKRLEVELCTAVARHFLDHIEMVPHISKI